MAAPPPPPPPPPAPGPIAKPNNNKLLESIRQGTGLKKVPDSVKNDRSAAIIAAPKSGGNASAMPLPAELKGSSGGPMSIADALKARAEAKARGASSTPLVVPPKRSDIPPPNQNVGPTGNIPKPPDPNSKPSVDTKAFPPPPPPLNTGQASKPIPPPPIQQGIQNKPLPPPSMGNGNKPFHSLPMPSIATDKPIPPPPMPVINSNKPIPPPPMSINMSSIPPPPPPPMDSKHSIPPPVFYSMKPTTAQDVVQPPMIFPPANRMCSLPNPPNFNSGSARNTPPLAPPPPPPPLSSMPTKPGKPAPLRPPQAGSEIPNSKPPLPVRDEIQSTFDSKFTFVDESLFPPPDTVMKRTKVVC